MQKIEAKIKALTDPKNGDCFVDEVRRRETIYSGPYVNQAPDLLLKMKNYGYLLNKSMPTRGNSILREVTGPEGCHRSDGIFAAYGYNIDHKTDLQASIMDVTPTVLYTLDMSLPKDLDGKPLTHIFTSEFQHKTRLRFNQEDTLVQINTKNEIEYSKTEEREIRNRLKELGYLD
jgi:predicted AlkP superfamily phosphohydrolase/phosphomutase